MINGAAVAFSSIPVMDYAAFAAKATTALSGNSIDNHCVTYFAFPYEGACRLLMGIACDSRHTLDVFSCPVPPNASLASLTSQIPALSRFEREMAAVTALRFEGHPRLKPLRTTPDDYPFDCLPGEGLHQVGVGPIHAGVIEPGHFRFTCDGEQILNLEIMLGYQHRGIERLMVEKTRLMERVILAEAIAGDTAVGHGIAFARTWEGLCGFSAVASILWARTLAAELERMAIHTGDLSALCGDVAYQLGAAVYGRLRTPLINFMQQWCGNRLGKTCVRPFFTPYPFTPQLAQVLLKTLDAFERDFVEMGKQIARFPSVLSRLERTGVVTAEQVCRMGAVGMAARASGLERDVRSSHPYLMYELLAHKPVVKHHGDVYSRLQVRKEEVMQSMGYVRTLLQQVPDFAGSDGFVERPLKPGMFALSLTEGWRGELCHCALTDAQGKLAFYKVKDASFHNWDALELAVRNNGISDFPICNKSFNLSYCGHDL